MSSSVLARTLGKSNLPVSAIGLGCWAIGGPFWRGETPVGWGKVDDEESIRAIQRGLELGITFFDTANVYGAGHSERVLGRALAGKRQQVVIATKFGNVFNEDTRQVIGSDASAAGIRRQCEDSLKRLNTDHIDLYQFHLGDYALDKAGEVRDTLEALAREGKIRSYGWSTDDPARARFFGEGAHCGAVQVQMNVLDDAPEMTALCETMNLASVNRGPLAMGLLTGKYSSGAHLPLDDVRSERSPDWMKYFKGGQANPEWLKKLEAIRAILTSEGRTLAQGALAWLLTRTPKTVPIPGFRTVAQVEENSGALRVGLLTAEQMASIDKLLDRSTPARA